jgi:DNA-binding transcriptional LysR family regulator
METAHAAIANTPLHASRNAAAARVFEASARHACFTARGEELHLAQPTVSSQMRKLSETLGAPLFETVGRGVRLTEAGRRTYAHCRELFALLGRLDDALCELRDVEGSELRLAVAEAASRHAARCSRLSRRSTSGVAVRVRVANRAALLRACRGARTTCTSSRNAPDDVPLVRQRVGASALVIVAPRGPPLRHGAASDSRSSRKSLGAAGNGLRHAAPARRRLRARRHAAVALELTCEDAILCAGREGAGLPSSTATAIAARARVAVLDVDGFPLPRTWHLAYAVGASPRPPPARPASVRAGALVQALR